MFNFSFRKQTPQQPFSVPSVCISEEVLSRTKGLLLSYSQANKYHEGIVYWAGRSSQQHLIVSTALTPQAQTTPESVNIGIIENAQVVAEINRLGLQIIAQVHSHPFQCGEGHSEGDSHMIFMPFEGLLSIVVKDFALDGLFPITRTGVHIFHNGQFVRLSSQQVETHFKVVPTHLELRK